MVMTQKEIQNEIASVNRMLELILVQAPVKGQEVSVAYEAGMYIGAIKATIQHLTFITEKK
jgi:hypothetical protein